MRIYEFDNLLDQAGYVNLADDKFDQASIKNTRKKPFTLRHLNKLKKMRAAEDLERIMRMDTLEIIYGSPEEEAAGGMGL